MRPQLLILRLFLPLAFAPCNISHLASLSLGYPLDWCDFHVHAVYLLLEVAAAIIHQQDLMQLLEHASFALCIPLIKCSYLVALPESFVHELGNLVLGSDWQVLVGEIRYSVDELLLGYVLVRQGLECSLQRLESGFVSDLLTSSTVDSVQLLR